MSRTQPLRSQHEAKPADPESSQDPASVDESAASREGELRSPVRRAGEHLPTVSMPQHGRATYTESNLEEEMLATLATADEALTELEIVVAETVDPQERMPTVVLAPQSGDGAGPQLKSTPETSDEKPITPRRKKRRAKRVALQPAAQPELDAAEVERMLASACPGVIECWVAHEDVQSKLVIQDDIDRLSQEHLTPLLLVNEFTPSVIEVLVEVPAETVPAAHAIAESSPEVAQALFTNQGETEVDHLASIVEGMLLPEQDRAIISAYSEASDSPPRIATIELSFAEPFPPAVEVDSRESDAETVEDERTPTELELAFDKHESPRRRSPDAPPVEPQRPVARPDPREQEVRRLVRSPESRVAVTTTAWEEFLQADLEDRDLAAAIDGMLDRWQRDGDQQQTNTLLVCSSGASQEAAEVVMLAALRVTRTSNAKVLLIDCDCEGVLTSQLGMTGKTGLTDLIVPADAHGEAVQPTATSRLHVLPFGRVAWSRATVITAVQQLLGDLSHEYEWILVAGGVAESPPVRAMARVCYGTYVVTPLGNLSVAEAQRQLATLRNAGARVLGSMVVRRDDARGG